jgi:formylglycine-generating enzyme required for sulfatase activity
MILIDGNYCPNVKQTCAKWVDPPDSPYPTTRCAEYSESKCEGDRVHKRYCVDREEYTEQGSTMPIVSKSWTEAAELCEARGARLCTEAEWTFACEGEELRPYPYGFKRDNTLCNFDKTNLGGPEDKLHDLRAPITDYPQCLSPFGVHNIVGNVDEWTVREDQVAPNRSALRGGWWLPGRNRCRAATTAHAENYSGKQVGFRCCRDTQG